MKTCVHLYNWLLHTALMFVALTGSLTAVAQTGEIEGGEAFYIYQNDGHFDGFFYDEVKQIRYSCLDTLNREHDHYVSQEIVTEDSVYRIMLTAIDSVSFYQPEIKYAQGMRFMRDEGMLDYLINTVKDNEDKIFVTFRADMPANIRPKVGDVLSCPSLDTWEEGAFVAKVDNVTQAANILLLQCSYVENLGDVFEQFITVEQVREQVKPDGSRTIRRRMAGLDHPKKGIEGHTNDLSIFDFNATLEGSLYLTDNFKVGIAINAGFGMMVSATYKISLSEFYVKTELKEQVGIGGTASFDGQLYGNADLDQLPGVGALISRFSKIPFPASFPILYVDMVPKPFSRVEAHVVASLGLSGEVKALAQSIEINQTFPFVHINMRNLPGTFLPLPQNITPDGKFTISAELNGYFQSGLKFPIELGTDPWLRKITNLRIGTKVYAGPKVYGALTADLRKVYNNKGVYSSLKDSKVGLTLMNCDIEASAEGSFMGKKTERKWTRSFNYGKYELTLFPDIEDTEYEITGTEMNTVKASFNTSGDVFLPQKLGIALYTKENDDDKEFMKLYEKKLCHDPYFLNNYNSVDFTFENVKAGVYKIRPIINLIAPDVVIPVYEQEQLITIAPQEVELKPASITAEEEGGKFEVELLTSINQKLTASPDDDWIETEIKYDVGPTKSTIMYVTVKENATERFRKSGVTVTQVLKDGSLCERKLEVKQYGGLQLAVNKVGIEAGDSTVIIDILTSYNPITINLNGNNWMSYKLEDRKLILTVKKNEGIERKGTVTVAAWSKKHNGISAVELEVTQKGPVDVSLDKDALTFKANGGSEQVNLTLGGNYAFTDVRVSHVDDSWLIVEKHDNYFIATAMPNTEEEEINSVIELVFTKVKQGVPGPATCVVPFSISQDAALPEPGEFTIKSLSLGTTFGVTCTNLGQYKERPFEEWEPEKKASMGFFYDNGDENRSAVITIIDENTLRLECKKDIEETDPEYPGFVAQTVETFTATLTKSKEVKEDGEEIIHIRVSDVHHVRDHTELYEGTKYTNHSEYTIAPSQKLSVMAYPTIYDENLKVQYHGSLIYNGFRKLYGNVFGTLSFYEEFSWNNGANVQKYVYANSPDETDGISLQIKFEPSSLWDAWLEGKQVDDTFSARAAGSRR